MSAPVLAHLTHFVELLTRVAESNELAMPRSAATCTSLFDSDTADGFSSMYDLLVRLDTYLRCSESCFALALIYIDRVIEMSTDGLQVNHHTIRRLLISSLLLANHMLDDVAEQITQFSFLSNIPAKLLVALKTDFVRRVDFRLFVAPEEILSFSDTLKGRFSTSGFREMGLMWPADLSAVPCFVEQTPPLKYSFPAQQVPSMAPLVLFPRNVCQSPFNGFEFSSPKATPSALDINAVNSRSKRKLDSYSTTNDTPTTFPLGSCNSAKRVRMSSLPSIQSPVRGFSFVSSPLQQQQLPSVFSVMPESFGATNFFVNHTPTLVCRF